MAPTATILTRPAARTPRQRGPRAQRPGGPKWRALLEARWRDRLQEVTELSLAFHDAAGQPSGGAATPGDSAQQQLLERAVAARRVLADIEDALGRLAAGRYGTCEQCGAAIPLRRLRRAPEVRYCPECVSAPSQ